MKKFLAENRSERHVVRAIGESAFTELEKEPAIRPILAALGKLKDVFRGNRAKANGLAGTGFAFMFQFKFGAPKAVDPIFEFLNRAQLAAMGALRILADVADRLDCEYAGFGVGHPHLELSGGGHDASHAQRGANDDRTGANATHLQDPCARALL